MSEGLLLSCSFWVACGVVGEAAHHIEQPLYRCVGFRKAIDESSDVRVVHIVGHAHGEPVKAFRFGFTRTRSLAASSRAPPLCNSICLMSPRYFLIARSQALSDI